MLIAFEGIDQSGKKTQARLLLEKLQELGHKVNMISFPDYSTPLGREIKAFLKGEKVYDPRIRQLLYAGNRWERKSRIVGWLKKGRIVIADRYIPSGLAYGMANGLDLDWMIELEKGLPEPDLVIVINVSLETAFSRKAKRDFYEKDVKFLKKVRGSYLKLAKKFGWTVVDGEKRIEEVHKEIWRKALEYLRAR